MQSGVRGGMKARSFALRRGGLNFQCNAPARELAKGPFPAEFAADQPLAQLQLGDRPKQRYYSLESRREFPPNHTHPIGHHARL